MALSVHDGDIIGGKYRVDGVIGRGGMGIVLAATHLTLGTTVAIKVLTYTQQRADEVEQLVQEARLAARLKGDHVVRVFDVGLLESGAPFVVMEHLAGRSLYDAIAGDQGHLAVSRAIDLMLQICDAVSEAHALGIVHRDLKPSNVFLAALPNGREVVKVLDFGLAQLVGDGPPTIAVGPHPAASLGSFANVVGTPDYMAPEQFSSRPRSSTASDVWALGVMFYELLAGRRPFGGMTFTELVTSISVGPITPLRALRPDVLPEIEALVARCLNRDPHVRPSSVGWIAAELERQRLALGAPTGPVPAVSFAHSQTTTLAMRRWWPLVASVIAAAGAVLSTTLAIVRWRTPHPPPAASAAIAPPVVEPPPPSVTAHVTMRGSATVAELAKGWSPLVVARRPNTSFHYEATSSASGLGALARGEVDLAGASRAATAEELSLAHANGMKLVEHVVARDGLAVVIHPENPVEAISVEQLSGILSGRIANWSALGGKPAPIRVLARGEDQGEHEIVKSIVFHPGDTYSERAEIVRKTEDVVQRVRLDPTALGLVSSRATGPTKTLALRPAPHAAGIAPSSATIRSGRYPLRRDLYVYARADASPATQAVLSLILDPTSRVAAEAGFVPAGDH